MSIANVSFFPFSGIFTGCTLKTLRQDVFAGLVVALMAIPQSIAYSMLSGLPVTAGIFSAIFGTIFAAAWGSSKHLIAGPSTGMSVLLQTAIADTMALYFPNVAIEARNLIILQLLIYLVILIGMIQILFSLCNGAKLLQFVSRSVMLGYFGGVALAIFVGQVGNFLGISGSHEEGALLLQIAFLAFHLHEVNLYSFLLGVFSLVLIILFRRRFSNFPDALVMLFVSGFIAFGINYFFPFTIMTIKEVGFISVPLPTFTLPFVDFKIMGKLFPQAVALAFLGILEVFSISRALSFKSGQTIQANQEVFSIGISNFFLSFFQYAMPTSGSMSRSLLNYHAKAQSRLSALLSGCFVLLLLFLFYPFIAHIPLAALAALLFLSATHLVEKEQVKLCFKATKEDALVFLLTLASCLLFTLDIAFFIGIAISIISYLRKAAQPHLVEYAFNNSGHLVTINPSDKKHRKVRIIGIGGELFFAAVDVLQNALHTIAEDPYVKVIVLRLHGVYHMDASMCLAILRLHDYLKQTDRSLIISGITQEIWRVFSNAFIVEKIGAKNLFLTEEGQPQLSTWKACLRAQEFIPESIAKGYFVNPEELKHPINRVGGN